MKFEIKQKINSLNIKKMIIWGHKLHSHTHSYIHNAWFKFFNYLEIETLWLDNNDDISSLNFDNCLFFTEGQVDKNIPINNNSYYVLHNCLTHKYQELVAKKRVLIIHVFNNIVRDKLNFDNFNNLKNHYYLPDNIILILPWATDLTPEEINDNIEKFDKNNFENKANFIGSIWEDKSNKDFSNIQQMKEFRESCEKNEIEFSHYRSVSIEENIRLIQTNKYCPSIQGKWQCDHGYIPCRIFKNISYGGLAITNNKEVYNLFDEKIIFNENISELIDDTDKYYNEHDNNFFKDLMINVRDNHTYLNRINSYLDYFMHIDEQNICCPDLKYLNNIWGGFL